MMAVIPQGAWHRFHSSEGATLMTATPFPGEKIDLDVDDPRMVERKSAMAVMVERIALDMKEASQ
jgi:hypothetical protein